MEHEKIAALLLELDAQREQCEKLTAAQVSAREQLRAAGIEADLFRQKFAAALTGAKNRETELLAELAAATAAGEAHRRENETLQNRVAALDQQIKKERAEFLKQEKSLAQHGQKQRLRADEERLDRVKLESLLAETRRENAALKNSLAQLDETLRVHDKELRLTQHEHEILRVRAEQAVQTESEAVTALRQLREEHSVAAETYARQQAKNERELARMENLLADAVREREKIGFLRGEETAALQHRLEKTTRQLAENERQIVDDREKARELQAALAEARHLFSETQTEFEKRERKLLTDRETARADRRQLLDEIRRLDKEFSALKTKIRETEKSLAQERRLALTQTEQLRAQLRQATAMAERQNHELLAQLAHLKNHAAQVAEREAGFDREITEIRETARQREDQLAAELAAKRAAISQLSATFQEETRRNQALEEQIASLRNLLDERERKIQKRQAEWHQLDKAHEREILAWQEKIADRETQSAALQTELTAQTGKLAAAQERENHLRGTIRDLRQMIGEMQENVAASVASKAYYKEKYEAVKEALDENRTAARDYAEQLHSVSEQAERQRENHAQTEQQLTAKYQGEIQQLRDEHSRIETEMREELIELRNFRDVAAREINDERARSQEMLQNLLAMRDELESTRNASAAGKNFLKEKLQKTEEELTLRRAELAQERRARQALENQLQNLRHKIELV